MRNQKRNISKSTTIESASHANQPPTHPQKEKKGGRRVLFPPMHLK